MKNNTITSNEEMKHLKKQFVSKYYFYYI